jgi:hypothetical protein
MNQSLDFTSIKNGVLAGIAYAGEVAKQAKVVLVEWYGRAIRIIKIGLDYVQPHLQNQYIAAAAVVIASAVVLSMTEGMCKLTNYITPRATPEAAKQTLAAFVGFSVWISGMVAFRHYARIPLHPAVFVICTLAGPILAVNLQKNH